MLFVQAGANTFGTIQANVTGRPAATQGTAVTPVVGSKGLWTQLVASTNDETYGLLININSNTASAASRNSVIDIGIGAAGSEVVCIPDLLCGNAASYTTPGSGVWYYFPLTIKAGTRVAVRAQSTVTTAFRVFVQLMQRPLNPSLIKKATFVQSFGVTVPTGTAITPGTTAESGWVLLGTTTRRTWFWQLGAQIPSTDTTHNAGVIHLDLAEGNGTNFTPLVQDIVFTTSTTESHTNIPITVGCEFPVAEGKNIYVRAQSSTTAEVLHVAAYGAGG
jgi:hypothetical protein